MSEKDKIYSGRSPMKGNPNRLDGPVRGDFGKKAQVPEKPKDISNPGEEEESPVDVNEIEKQGPQELIERVVKIGRVSKVVKGGKNFSFNALVLVGDGRGKIGIGFGKSNDVVGAISKGTADAKKQFKQVELKGDSIPHDVEGRFKAARVILRPAGSGTGVIAGGPVRAACDAVGIKNILTKSLGSRTPVNVVKATMDAFMKLRIQKRG